MKPIKRIFLIVLDSMGIGEAPDAAAFGDEGSNTLAAISTSPEFHVPNLNRLGLFAIDGVTCCPAESAPQGAFARMTEISKGKDTTIGTLGNRRCYFSASLPTYPNGFPTEIIKALRTKQGAKSCAISRIPGRR